MADTRASDGLLGLLEQKQFELRRYLLAHGAGDAADDLLQELRLRILTAGSKPIAAPLGYLYRAATNLMIDHRRSRVQAEERDRSWSEATDRDAHSVDPTPTAERVLAARQGAEMVRARLSELPERARAVLLRHRIDGVSQRLLAEEFQVSQSTIESDLRTAYRWIEALRREMDEEKPR